MSRNVERGGGAHQETGLAFTFLLQFSLVPRIGRAHISSMTTIRALIARWRSIATTEQLALAILLVAIAGVAGALGYQAVAASRANVATARRALNQYSTIAAWQFTRAAQRELQMAAEASIGSRVQQARRNVRRDRASLLTPGELQAEQGAPECDCHGTVTPTQFFRWDAGSADLVTDGDWAENDRHALAQRIGREAARSAGEFSWGRADCALLLDHSPTGATRLIATAVVFDEHRQVRAIYGLTADAADARTLFERALRHTALLPGAVLSPLQQDSSIAIEVAAGAQPVFSRGPARLAEYRALDSLGSGAFRATVTLGLAPSAAERLLAGSVPQSRLPYIGVFLLITAGLLAVALRQMHRTAQLASLRADFVASVSHELRTPLSLIRVYTETLIEEDPPERRQRQHFFGVIMKETNRLSGMVEDLLRFAELEQHTLALSLSARDLATVLDAAIADYRPLARSRDVEIAAQLAPDLVAGVDASALRQMLFNLLGNAVKYGSGRQVVVRLRRDAESAEITVDDEGPGIPREQRRRVFERYVRLVDVERGGAPGSGIGLAIVRELARAQRMAVWIDDAPSGGARIVLRVPLIDSTRSIAAVDMPRQLVES